MSPQIPTILIMGDFIDTIDYRSAARNFLKNLACSLLQTALAIAKLLCG
jgi:hypothetical protein